MTSRLGKGYRKLVQVDHPILSLWEKKTPNDKHWALFHAKRNWNLTWALGCDTLAPANRTQEKDQFHDQRPWAAMHWLQHSSGRLKHSLFNAGVQHLDLEATWKWNFFWVQMLWSAYVVTSTRITESGITRFGSVIPSIGSSPHTLWLTLQASVRQIKYN